MRRAVTLFLLLCATVHCVLSIFTTNVSYLVLSGYAAGLAPRPFQHRLLMIPFLRWAAANSLLNLAAVRYQRFLHPPEPMSAAKLGCALLAIVAVAALGLVSMRLAPRLALRLRWLPWALLLVILYASYAARYEQALWYPYDLPHVALFGLATLFLFTDSPWLFLLCLAPDVFLRETSIFLVPVALAVHGPLLREPPPRRRAWIIACAAVAALWLCSRLLAQHLYPHNPYEWNAVPWFRMAAPWHWPQIFSIAGFLWIPVLLARRSLTPVQRRALYAATLCMAVTFFFATWNETRAWSEWSMLFALLAARALEQGTGNRE
jgi:hypothetical protein